MQAKELEANTKYYTRLLAFGGEEAGGVKKNIEPNLKTNATNSQLSVSFLSFICINGCRLRSWKLTPSTTLVCLRSARERSRKKFGKEPEEVPENCAKTLNSGC